MSSGNQSVAKRVTLLRKEMGSELPRLKEVRERQLLTQAELATRSGVAETTINRIENARHEARFSTIKKLAEALGVQPQALLGG